jgi:hypothetical protein
MPVTTATDERSTCLLEPNVATSFVAVVTGIVISISKQEYMFGYKAPVVAVRVFWIGTDTRAST